MATLVSAQPYGLANRGSVGPFLNGAMPGGPSASVGTWTVVKAFPRISFTTATVMTAVPGTNRLAVGEDSGMVWTFENDPNVASKQPFLDLRHQTQGWNGTGLLGIAFHPQFGQAGSPNRGYVYIYYQYTPVVKGSMETPPNNYGTFSYNRLSRFTVPDGASAADPGSEFVLINQFDRDLWHGGGALFFGTDGFLYFSNGDEGGDRDEYDQAQRRDLGLFGGVFRIDVDKNPARSHPNRRTTQSADDPPPGWPRTLSQDYWIPNDNPWLDPNGSVLEEFYAIGFRSPHRMTMDPVTGQIWLGDVGSAKHEEVDLVRKGGNYQWPWREGANQGPKNKPSIAVGFEVPPIYDYPHDRGNNCVIGGYVYRGSRFSAQLGGKYIFGDNISNRIWTLDYDGASGGRVTELTALPPGTMYSGGLSSFGVDRNGELYMLTTGWNAAIYKLELVSQQSTPVPALLSQTGAFADVRNLVPAPGVVPYTVNSPLWSDNAVKDRWMAIPAGTQIGFSPTGDWVFPPGSVFIKHFELPIDERNPGVRRRVETRLMVRDNSGGVYGATYRWRADNSDADLVTGGYTETFNITTASGGSRSQVYDFPSAQDCMLCHTPAGGLILGVKTRQLNGNFTYPSSGVTDNQLRTLNHVGMFTPALNEGAIGSYSRMVAVTDTSAPVIDRVRSYLDANCAQCHRPGSNQSQWDARYTTPLESQGILNGSVVNNLGIPGAKIIDPGSLDRSILYLRLATNGAHRMPPIARNVVDTAAVSALSQYINSLPPSQPPPPPPDGQVPGHLVNLSGRADAGTGSQTLIAGFVIGGSGGSKPLLVRGVGPTLVPLGVNDAVRDTYVRVVGNGSVLTENDDWDDFNGAAVDAAREAVGAHPLPAGSKDAAVLVTLTPGPYTAHVTGVGGSTGVALAEVYDASSSAAQSIATPLVNFSIRTQVGTGDHVVIAGFVVDGDTPAKLLIRGIGPGLTQHGVTGVLANPFLRVQNSTTVLAENDNWGSNANAVAAATQAVGAQPLQQGSQDAALYLTLPPGAYTAILSGVGNTTGVGLVEIYLVP